MSLLVPANFYFVVLRVAQQDADRIALIVLPNRLRLDVERLQLTQSGGNAVHMEHDMNLALLQIEWIDGRGPLRSLVLDQVDPVTGNCHLLIDEIRIGIHLPPDLESEDALVP